MDSKEIYFKLDGALFEKIVTAGADKLWANKKEINDLNVFPIPDGDTGDNMYMTASGGIGAIKREDSQSVAAKSAALARGMLFGARGNSGVILSQFFEGIARGLNGYEVADPEIFASALSSGVKKAYSSVERPVEGTMLTVLRESVEYASARLSADSSLNSLMLDVVAEMRRSLDRTPELLEVLMEAGVVDSGGAGVLKIAEGMLGALLGESYESAAMGTEAKDIDFSKFGEDSVMTFGYCTELLLQLQRCKVDPESFSEKVIVEYLETIGDSIVAVKTGSIVKLHVHTLEPYRVLEFCQRFGEYLTVKIENMTLQHNETGEDFATKRKKKPKGKRKKFALVTVANGDGMTEAFRESGADFVIDGGQGNNPSIDDFIDSFDTVNADDIFVLPNNGNIIMAAKQAASMYEGSSVHVIETKNFGEAYSILSMLDYSSGNAEDIEAEMRVNMQGSVTGMITSSIRSVTLDGVDVKEGEYIGFTNKTMLTSSSSLTDTFGELADKLSAKEKSFMVLFIGRDVSNDIRDEVSALVEERYPDLEFYPVDGGQDVYDFIMILE
ncbi:MAG: DAK2 domain-containing protein [Ruminococcaceae bacterium]|nr:DAK2 domain-containing protein [Oscillospiraceae bacterium]